MSTEYLFHVLKEKELEAEKAVAVIDFLLSCGPELNQPNSNDTDGKMPLLLAVKQGGQCPPKVCMKKRMRGAFPSEAFLLVLLGRVGMRCKRYGSSVNQLG